MSNASRIWVAKYPQQAIGFELSRLPGDEFLLVLPELISDAEDAILPWSQPTPDWEFGDDSARCAIGIDKVIRMEAEVLFGQEEIGITIAATNLSSRTWRLANAFTCFAFYQAPRFNDPGLGRTFMPVGENEWKPLADLFAEHSPGEGPYTFFRVEGGPVLTDLWLCRKIPQSHPQVASHGAMCVVSKDGRWIAGMSSAKPAYVFNNREEHCIHADPLLGTVQPGETAQAVSTLYVFEGSIDDLDRRMR